MSEPTQWRYLTAHVVSRVTKPRLFTADQEGYWAILLDEEYQLEDGLNYLGAQGYELVGIQPALLTHGGNVSGDYFPQSIYIFKQRIS